MSDVHSSAVVNLETVGSNNFDLRSKVSDDNGQVVKNRNEVLCKVEKQRSLHNLYGSKEVNCGSPTFQRERSNSDGAAMANGVDTSEAFPSLSNAVLEKLGLHGDASRDQLSQESLEQKFTSLSLAFTIDATTIKNRCERQRRSRDQTESNFNLEVERLKEKLSMLKPLCTDFETADLLSNLYSQVDTLTNAASLVSIAAERYGAVQHEERLTESVQLMVSHVQVLKQQRDSALRQLQYTKRVLQEPVDVTENKLPGTSSNKVLLAKRRASTDSVNLNPDQNLRLNRRMSDLTFKASLNKTRQSRLDLGMELNKIRELSFDEGSKDEPPTPGIPSSEISKDDADSDFELSSEQHTKNPCQLKSESHVLKEVSSLVRSKVFYAAEDIQKKFVELFNKWSENGYLHVFLNSCAILCFSVSVMTLISMLVEQSYSQSSSYWWFPWISRK